MGIVEKIAPEQLGQIGRVGKAVFEVAEKRVDEQGLFGVGAVLLDEAGAEKKRQAERDAVPADFRPFEFELMEGGFDCARVEAFLG